jgi:hypothetical protein
VPSSVPPGLALTTHAHPATLPGLADLGGLVNVTFVSMQLQLATATGFTLGCSGSSSDMTSPASINDLGNSLVRCAAGAPSQLSCSGSPHPASAKCWKGCWDACGAGGCVPSVPLTWPGLAFWLHASRTQQAHTANVDLSGGNYPRPPIRTPPPPPPHPPAASPPTWASTTTPVCPTAATAPWLSAPTPPRPTSRSPTGAHPARPQHLSQPLLLAGCW